MVVVVLVVAVIVGDVVFVIVVVLDVDIVLKATLKVDLRLLVMEVEFGWVGRWVVCKVIITSNPTLLWLNWVELTL